MNTLTVALVLSSRAAFDPDRVSAALHLEPTKIWRRKPNIKVYGPDRIPEMQWIFEQEGDSTASLEQTACAVLDRVCGNAEVFSATTTGMGLSASLVCRVISRESEQVVDLSSDTVARLAVLKMRLIWSVEFESADTTA